MNEKVTIETVENAIEHPLEEVFGIEPGTTMVPTLQRSSELIPAPTYDEKDKEVENQFEEIYNAAMGAFESQMQEAELVEGKYKARAGEVSVQFLNTALEAARSKSTLKQHKDKLTATAIKAPSTVNNNLIVADRNELLKNLKTLDLDNIPSEG